MYPPAPNKRGQGACNTKSYLHAIPYGSERNTEIQTQLKFAVQHEVHRDISLPIRVMNVFISFQVILQADKTSNNFSDRAILKNLGHWLGMQTLAKNKPILQIVSDI